MSCSLLLGTHDIHNISVTSPNPGVVVVTGSLINGSSMTGILIIVYSVMDDSSVHYNLFLHGAKQSDVEAVVKGLPGGQYEVSIFVMRESGLPLNRTAARPKAVWINGKLWTNDNTIIK